MFHSLFSHYTNKSLYCNGCKLAKHLCVNFTPNNKRNDFPFQLIHSDIWRPYNILTYPGYSGLFLFS